MFSGWGKKNVECAVSIFLAFPTIFTVRWPVCARGNAKTIGYFFSVPLAPIRNGLTLFLTPFPLTFIPHFQSFLPQEALAVMMVYGTCVNLWLLLFLPLIASTRSQSPLRRNHTTTPSITTSSWYSRKTSIPTQYPTIQPTHPTYQPTTRPTSAPTKTPPAPLNLLVFGRGQ